MNSVSLSIVGRKIDRRAVFGTMLLLMFTSVLTFESNMRVAGISFETSEREALSLIDDAYDETSHVQIVDEEQARIVEHRITALELEELKRRIGVREESRNYNDFNCS